MDTQFYGLCIELQCILGVQAKPGPMPTAKRKIYQWSLTHSVKLTMRNVLRRKSEWWEHKVPRFIGNTILCYTRDPVTCKQGHSYKPVPALMETWWSQSGTTGSVIHAEHLLTLDSKAASLSCVQSHTGIWSPQWTLKQHKDSLFLQFILHNISYSAVISLVVYIFTSHCTHLIVFNTAM